MPADLHDPLPRLDRGLADLRADVDRRPAADPAVARQRAGRRRHRQLVGSAGAVLAAAAVVGALLVGRPPSSTAPGPAGGPDGPPPTSAPPGVVEPSPGDPDGRGKLRRPLTDDRLLDPRAADSLRPYGPWTPIDTERSPLARPLDPCRPTTGSAAVDAVARTYGAYRNESRDLDLLVGIQEYATSRQAESVFSALAEGCGPGWLVRGGTYTTQEPEGRFSWSVVNVGAEVGGQAAAFALVDRRIVHLSVAGDALTAEDVLDGGDAENALLGALGEAISRAR